MNSCKACGSASVREYSSRESLRYKGRKIDFSVAFSVCDVCDDEFLTTDQIRVNDRAVVAAKRNAEGLLSPEEVKTTRQALGLNQERAAQLFGGGRNAFSKYERGEVAQSVAMDRLIRVCRAHPDLLDELHGYAGAEKRMINARATVVSLHEWQADAAAVNDDFYRPANKELRSFPVSSPDQEPGYGS
ncbi:MAG: type II toxin-antitoxin system MqsA family antitoxin [Marinobacter sp.]|uniref:type II toxin-antitoxin system MqsA family antitoxin n=1 Tax=Marinobacter sp. TaxID=50741 RepID=UPI0034A06D3B